MKKKLNIVIEFPLLNKDFNRFGIKYLSKKFDLEIVDISNLTNKDMSIYEYTDPYIHNMKKDFILNKIISIRELFKFINRNKKKLTIDYLSDKPVNELIRYVMYFSKLKLIKTSHGMHPTQLPNYKQFEFYLKKILSISAWINFLAKNLRFNYWYIYIVSCKKAEKLLKSEHIIYSHTFDYDIFLNFKKKKYDQCLNKNNIKKSKAVFIDQNLADNTDFIFTKNKTVTRDIYYNELVDFFKKLKSDWDISIAVHPKNKIEIIKKYFKDFKISIQNTINEVENSDIVFCHYSTALNFAYLFNKPIIMIHTNEMMNKKYYIRSMLALSNYHNIKSINISNFNYTKFNFKKNSNISKYKKYLSDYIKHPKSKQINSWEIFSNFIEKVF